MEGRASRPPLYRTKFLGSFAAGKRLRYRPRGLRGSSLSVVWRGDWDLVALETWRAVAKSNDGYIKNRRTTWQTCNNSKNQS